MMTIWQALKSFISNNTELITLISIALGMAGVVLAIYFYRRGLPLRQLSCACRTFRIISEKCHKVPGLNIAFENQDIPSLSLTRMAVWNAGTEPLRSHDIAPSDPLIIGLQGSSTRLLKLTLVETTRQANGVAIESLDSVGNNPPKLTFDYLNPCDGLLIEVIHTGTSLDEVELRGSLVGAIIRKTAADPETMTTSAGPHGASTIITVESGRSHSIFLGYGFLIMSALLMIVTIFAAYFENTNWPAFLITSALSFAFALGQFAYTTKKYPPSKLRIFDNDL